MDVHKLVSAAQSTDNQVTIEATVVTGFEDVVVEECLEKIGKSTPICKSTGRVFFNADLDYFNKIRELRGIDNILLIVSSFENVGFSNKGTDEGLSFTEPTQIDLEKDGNKLKDIATIQNRALQINWKKYMDIWKKMTNYNGILYPTNEQFEKYNTILRHQKNIRHDTNHVNHNTEDKNIDGKEKLQIEDCKLIMDTEKLLKFRVTCNRVGKHTVSSTDIERAFGGKLNDQHLWLVDLDDYDIEISLQIKYNEAYVGLSVTRKSLHRRNIVEFNLTTLKATIAYNMVRLAAPLPGDVFLDPMCGGGTIPLECTLSYPHVFFVSGDINEKLVLKTQANVVHNSTKIERLLNVSPLVCNVRHLCFKPASVDAVVSDLPFGKRVGSKSNNFLLYRLFLVEVGKLVRPHIGRAVLLTSDRKHLIQALHVSSALWKCGKQIKINMSGIKSFVFVLSRTAVLFDYALHGLKEKHKGTPFPPRKV